MPPPQVLLQRGQGSIISINAKSAGIVAAVFIWLLSISRADGQSLPTYVGSDPSASSPQTVPNGTAAFNAMLIDYTRFNSNSGALIGYAGREAANFGGGSLYNPTGLEVAGTFSVSNAANPTFDGAVVPTCAGFGCGVFAATAGHADVLAFAGGSITFSFNSSTDAFGFWLTGQQNGALSLSYTDTSGLTRQFTPLGASGGALNTTGGASFYGFIVNNGAPIIQVTLSDTDPSATYAVDSIVLAAPVPLPGTVWLMLSGLGGLGMRSRMKMR